LLEIAVISGNSSSDIPLFEITRGVRAHTRDYGFMAKEKKTSPASSSDSGYRYIFDCPQVVRDLLIGYVPGKWLEDVDFSTLTRVNASYVSEDEKQRHDDMVWRVQINGRWLWIYVILEFQSAIDSLMALRIMEYVSMLALQIAREYKKSELPEGRIPPILPIVLYNGQSKWSAPTNTAGCFIEPPAGLKAFLPKLKYLLLDERRLKRSRTKEVRNFADAVFRMEAGRGKADIAEIIEVIKALVEMLQSPELKELRRAFNVWGKSLLKRRAQDTKVIEKIDGIKDIFKEYGMVKAVYEDWDVIVERRGEQKGERKGETKLLVRLLTRRFGELPKWAKNRVSKAKTAQLEQWADAVLDASTLTEVLGAPDAR
jgi:predicted transposase YdaD